MPDPSQQVLPETQAESGSWGVLESMPPWTPWMQAKYSDIVDSTKLFSQDQQLGQG